MPNWCCRTIVLYTKHKTNTKRWQWYKLRAKEFTFTKWWKNEERGTQHTSLWQRKCANVNVEDTLSMMLMWIYVVHQISITTHSPKEIHYQFKNLPSAFCICTMKETKKVNWMESNWTHWILNCTSMRFVFGELFVYFVCVFVCSRVFFSIGSFVSSP